MSATSSKLIKGATGDWEMVIGLEVHAQVISNSKLFSGASTEFGGEPNSHVSLVDAAMPGMLPVINEACIRQAVRTGLGLNAQINLRSVFDRKNYFYPDSPQGYQISQYKSPIVGEGEVVVELADGESVTVGIERLHLEQDAAKSLHDQRPDVSFVDLNRSGVALMEIVSKPDIRSAEQAKAYVAKLRSILRYLGTCDGDMEKGSLRADVNVSVRKPGGPLGTRCEIKNMNSINFIGQAIEYEARRQIEILEDGGTIDQETRLFDPNKGETRSMRSKEEAHDYRYFPDPDLLPLEFSEAYVADLRSDLPELPDQKKARFIAKLGMNAYTAGVLVSDKAAADFFEETLSKFEPFPMGEPVTANEVSKWVTGELFGRLNKAGIEIERSPIKPVQMAELLSLIFDNTISGTIGKQVLDRLWDEGGSPREIVERLGLKQVTDLDAIEKVVDDIMSANPDKVAQARAKPAALQWFVGQVMKASGGKADPKAVNVLLKSKLGIEGEEGGSGKDRKRNRDVLFEDRTRTRQQPLQSGERLFNFYDECARKGYDEFRSTLNLWLSEFGADDRAKLISRMRNGGNNAFGAALCELVIHALLIRLKCKVLAHPTLQGTNARPDFAVTDEAGRLFYVEVTTANKADETVDTLNREAAIYNSINQAKLPRGCLLGYELIEAGPDNPDSSGLVSSIERWATENVDSASAAPVIRRFTVGEWTVELELFSGGNSGSEAPAIGVAWGGGGVIAPHEDIRGKLIDKSKKYGAMDAPYLIVVADAKDQMFGKDQVKNAITEAVFGDELTVFVDGRPRLDFAHNGFWIGPRNQHVTAVLLMPETGIWRLREPKWEPILAVNPWSTCPLPDAMKRLRRLEAEDGKWVEREGKPFADTLGLPMPWPPEENLSEP